MELHGPALKRWVKLFRPARRDSLVVAPTPDANTTGCARSAPHTSLGGTKKVGPSTPGCARRSGTVKWIVDRKSRSLCLAKVLGREERAVSFSYCCG